VPRVGQTSAGETDETGSISTPDLDRQPPDFHQESRQYHFRPDFTDNHRSATRQSPDCCALTTFSQYQQKQLSVTRQSPPPRLPRDIHVQPNSPRAITTRYFLEQPGLAYPMGNSPSVDQGSLAGVHDGDVRSSDSEKRHDWSKEQLATAKPEEQSPQEKRQPYTSPAHRAGK